MTTVCGTASNGSAPPRFPPLREDATTDDNARANQPHGCRE